MKRLAVILSVMLSIMTANAQDALLYSGVQQAEGLTASELFSNCNTWVATSFNSAKDVTQMSADNKVIIKAKHLYEDGQCKNCLDFTLTVECRDGRYKWTLSQICLTTRWMTNPKEFEFGILTTAETTDQHKGFFGGNRVKKIWNLAQQEAEILQNTISASLANTMTVKQAAEDW